MLEIEAQRKLSWSWVVGDIDTVTFTPTPTESGMLFFCVLHVRSGDAEYIPVIYWIVVAVIGSFICFGRFVLNPY